MADTNKKYENRYWLATGADDDVFELHFEQYYDDEVILKFVKDKNDLENYIYVSDLLNVEHDEIIQADSVDDAMEQFEDMVAEYIQDEISYYENMLEKFQEKSIIIEF